MPPAPARIASTPRENSRTSWNPAVPPPPAPGGSAGNELGGGLALDGGALDGGALDGGGLDGGALDGGALDGGALDGGALDAGPPGNEGGVVGGVPDEQADTDAVASMAMAAQPRTVPRRRRRP